jgi:hypothetical protein
MTARATRTAIINRMFKEAMNSTYFPSMEKGENYSNLSEEKGGVIYYSNCRIFYDSKHQVLTAKELDKARADRNKSVKKIFFDVINGFGRGDFQSTLHYNIYGCPFGHSLNRNKIDNIYKWGKEIKKKDYVPYAIRENGGRVPFFNQDGKVIAQYSEKRMRDLFDWIANAKGKVNFEIAVPNGFILAWNGNDVFSLKNDCALLLPMSLNNEGAYELYDIERENGMTVELRKRNA